MLHLIGHLRTVVSITVTAALLVTVAGCGPGADPSTLEGPSAPPGHPAAMEPSATPSPALIPLADPRASREITGDGYRIAAGSAFEQLDKNARNGEPMLVLRRPSSDPAVPTVVSVLREPKPAQGVVQESYVLELAQRTARGSIGVLRSRVTWPDARASVLVQWTQRQAGATGDVSVRYWQLNSEVNDGLTLVVVGFSPIADFDSSGVMDTMSSFRIRR